MLPIAAKEPKEGLRHELLSTSAWRTAWPLPEAAQRFTPFWQISRRKMDLVRLLFLRFVASPWPWPRSTPAMSHVLRKCRVNPYA